MPRENVCNRCHHEPGCGTSAMFLCILQMMHYGTQTRDRIKPCKRLVRHTRNIDWQHARALSFCAGCWEKTIYLRMQARDHFTEWTISSHQACRVVVWHICTWAWQGAVAPPNRIYRHITVVEKAPSRHYSLYRYSRFSNGITSSAISIAFSSVLFVFGM